MLENYLEYNIQQKIHLFFVLLSYNSTTTKELSEILDLSVSSVGNLVNELNADLEGLAEIDKTNSGFSISGYDNVDFLKSLHAIYEGSVMLQCLKFLITNDSRKPFSDFIDNHFVAKSAAYRIRANCLEYLHTIGLNIVRNKVVGEEYRIRFLIALLYYRYGINCCDIDEKSIQLARTFILATNQVIDLDFLKQTSMEYGYFECLLVLSWKRKKYPLSFPTAGTLEKLKELFIYKDMKRILKDTVEDTLNIEFCENDYDYIFLAYCCTNSCVFSDKWTQKDIEQVHSIVFSSTNFSNLLQLFEQRFGTDIGCSSALRTTLVYFFKKCLFDLQCIIPDKYFYLESKKDCLSLNVIQCVSEILDSWKMQNNIEYEIDDKHIFYLSLQIKSILQQFTPPVQVVIASDLIAELESIKLFLRRKLSSQRITVIPVLFNTQEAELLRDRKDSVIIINRKFESIINSLGCPEHNTIVPITIEIHSEDMETIENAISNYEKDAFLHLIHIE